MSGATRMADAQSEMNSGHTDALIFINTETPVPGDDPPRSIKGSCSVPAEPRGGDCSDYNHSPALAV